MNSEPATGTKVERDDPNALRDQEASCGQAAPRGDVGWIAGLLQAADSYYPTGSYAHSFGLEGLVQEGAVRDRETLRQFFRLSVLPALRQAELPLTAHAWRAFGDENWAQLGELSRLSAALRAPREIRQASENIGRQRVELVAALRPHPLVQEYQRRLAEEGWPHSAAISAALEGHSLGAPLSAVMTGVYYTAVAAVLAAAMKILRLGQNAAQSLLTEVLREAPAVIGAAERVPIQEIGWFNPWLDIASARHETADSRMFIS
jgi:urease accessory protein